MRNRLFFLFWFASAASILSIAVCAAHAQPPSKPGATSRGPTPPRASGSNGEGGVRASELKTYYLRDENGGIVPVLSGFTFEEFERLYKLAHNLPEAERPPSYSLQSIRISGSANGRMAELDVIFQIEVPAAKEGWVRVPLLLNEAVLREPSSYLGPGEHFLEYDRTGDGYVSWLRVSRPVAITDETPRRNAAGRETPAEAESVGLDSDGPLPSEPESREDREERAAETGNKADATSADSPEASDAELEGLPDVGGLPELLQQPAANSRHEVQLKLMVPLVSIGSKQRLSLGLPSAVTSQLQLVVDLPQADATLDGGNGVGQLSSAALDDGRKTRFTVRGVGGPLQLTWQPAATEAERAPQVLEAHGAVEVWVAGQQHIRSEARLRVRSFGGPIESFLVRLPPGMELIPYPQPGVQLARVEPTSAEETEGRGQLVEVKLERQTDTLDEVRLLAEMTPPEGGADAADLEASPLEVAGFDVLGAVRQWGHLEFIVEGDWSVRWLEGANVRRVDDAPDAARQQNIAARFEYYRQPYSLQVQVLPKERRVSVEPSYELFVQGGRVQLDALLKYRVRGAKARSVEVDLPGWKVDGIFPENLVDAESLDLEQTSPLTIPLSRQVAPGEFELQVQAHRTIDSEQESLSLTLPRPRDSTLSPATLVVTSADNVELTPRQKEMQGLIPQTLPVATAVAGPGPSAMYFRERGAEEASRFVADYHVRKRSVSVSVGDQVDLDGEYAVVKQQFSYRISFEPLNELLLNVPREVVEGGELELFLVPNRDVLTWEVQDDSEQSSATRVLLRVPLDERLGPLELVMRYRLPMPALEAQRTTAVTLPLAVPAKDAETSITRNTLHVTFPYELQVEPAASKWSLSERLDAAIGLERGQLDLEASGEVSELGLNVTLAAQQLRHSVSLRQAWVQSWLNGKGRRDRAVLRFRTAERRVRLQLPAARVPDHVALDGQRVPDPLINEEGLLEVETPGGELREHVLELWYQGAAHTATGRLRIDMPQLIGADRAQQWYWQLITSADQHLLWSPAGLTPELHWRWNGWHWGREASRQQLDLEEWIGATRQDTPLPEATNQYLFTTFGPLESVDVVLASRSVVVLTASMSFLLAGLLLIYFPTLRHPALLFSGALLLAAAATISPGTAAVVAQAGTLGLLLVLAARFLQWALTRRPAAPSVLHGSSLIMPEAKSTEMQVVRGEEGSDAAKSTTPLSIPLSSMESKG